MTPGAPDVDNVGRGREDEGMATGFAHGKVLLFGEHAVVYGQPAVALGTARGISARASRGPARLRVGAWSLDVAPGEGRVGASLQAILRVLRERLDAPDLGATLDVAYFFEKLR